MNGTLLFLGTGSSAGIPLIGCQCEVCKSVDPHNKRLRPCCLITYQDKKILLDVGPDFRYQALRADITHLDGLILTHTHFDHIGGLDELRIFYIRNKKNLPVLLSQASLDELKIRFYYFFKEKSNGTSLSAQFDFIVLNEKKGEIEFLGLPLFYLHYKQGGMGVTGYRMGDLAYITDIYEYDESIFDDLKGVKTLIVSAIGHNISPVHFTIQEAVNFANRLGAKKTYFIHMSHQLDHQKTNVTLPEGMALAHDGLTLEFSL